MVVLMMRVSLCLAGFVCAMAFGSGAVRDAVRAAPPTAQASASGSGSGSAAAARQDTQVVEVTAERFAFTPSEVRAKLGTPLEFRLQSDDTDHGFRILGTTINVRIPKRSRGTMTVRFAPEKAGRYTFECSKLCGAGHSFMRGVIVVEE